MRWGIFIAGLLLMLAGLQLSIVESYVLTPEATRVLAGWAEKEPGSVPARLRTLVIASSSPRHVVRPPRWLGWCALSGGCVTVGLMLFAPRRK